MDTAADRAAIAAAASAVAGVKCTPGYRQLAKVGDACVRLAGMVRDTSGFGFIVTWQVMVAVSQDLAAAETWIDTHADALTTALAAELVVTQIAPIELVYGTGSVPAVAIEGTRAA